MDLKICKVCLNKKSLNKFYNHSTNICQVCTDIKLLRCLNCNNLMINNHDTNDFIINNFDNKCCSKECFDQYHNLLEKKKCRICKILKTIDNFDFEKRGGDPDYEKSNDLIPKNKCRDCNYKDRCQLCKEIKNYDRFYLFRNSPLTDKCKDCYIKDKKIKFVKKLF